ncbi:unnamed protein product, partial [Ranitomeya imitator]
MRADLDNFPGFFPVIRLVWSELIPRLVWRGARELNAMERSRHGVHLNDAGLDMFLDDLREGVVQALHSL